MRRRRGAEPGSLEAVYDELAPAVLGFFRAHRAADPEGLTGDVFVSVARRLAAFDGDAHARRRWVFTIAHNRWVDEVRSAVRRADAIASERADAVAAPADEPLDPALVRALAALTPDQREVVVLRHVADLSVADVARATGRSEGSVKMLCQRGLDALAQRLASTEAP